MNKLFAWFDSVLKALLTVVLLVLLPLAGQGQTGDWVPVTPSNTPKWVGHSLMVNNRMYVFSGFDQPSVRTTPKCEVYDPQNNQWTYLVDMPTPVTHAGAAVDGDKVYIAGGFTGGSGNSNLLQIYNTATNTWSNGPVLPAIMGGNALVRVGRKLHAFGGVLPDRQTGALYHYVLDLDAPGAGWSTAAPMPEPRCHFAAAAVAGKIYALGGQTGHDGANADVKIVQVYDPVTDTWNRLKDMPYVRSHSETGTFVLDGKITLSGGRSSGENILATVTTYDPATDTWTEQAPLPAKLFGPSAEVIGNELIVSNGSFESRNNPQTKAYKRSLTRAPQYTMGFAPAQLKLSVAAGKALTRSALLWTLSGSPAYQLVPGTLPAWLQLSPASGIVDLLGGTEIDVRADAAGLAPGNYSATVTARAPGYPDAHLVVDLKVTPAEPGILYLYGSIPPAIHDMKLSDTGDRGMSQFRSALQESGFRLTEALDAQVSLDASTLASYQVLILGSNNRRFSEAERQAVNTWVRAGGGLVAWSDAAFGWANGGVNSTAGALSDNDLTQQFGMQFLRDNGVSVFSLKQWAVSHYINRFNKDGGLTIEAEGASPIRTTAPASILAYLPSAANKLNSLDGSITPADAALAVASPGLGRVLGVFDRNAFWNHGEGTWLSRVDNKLYAQRLMLWAAGLNEGGAPATPVVVSPLADMVAGKNSAPAQLDLSGVFDDDGGSASLALSVRANTNPGLVSTSLQNKILSLTYTPEATGTADITLRATDAEGLWAEDQFRVSITASGTDGQQVLSFSLINADNEQEIKVLAAGETLNLASLPTTNLNIRANTNPATVGSVVFNLSGQQTKNATETSAPYALFGDSGGNYAAWTPAAGSYTLKATPYTSGGGGGTAGMPLSLSFSVTSQASPANLPPLVQAGSDKTITLPANSVTLAGSASDQDGVVASYSWTRQSGPAATLQGADTPSLTASGLVAGTYVFRLTVSDDKGATAFDEATVTVNGAPAPGQQLLSFTLINAINEQELLTLEAGQTINLAELPTQSLNIRANTNPAIVGSVKFALGGAQTRNITESSAPYALYGDTNGNYYPWTPAVGSYTLTGTPYTGSGGGGTAGTPLSLSFQVVNQAARMAMTAPETASFGAEALVFPNPVQNGRFQLRLPQAVVGPVSVELSTITGLRLAKQELHFSAPVSVLPLDFTRAMPASGMYFLQLKSAGFSTRVRVVRQ